MSTTQPFQLHCADEELIPGDHRLSSPEHVGRFQRLIHETT